MLEEGTERSEKSNSLKMQLTHGSINQQEFIFGADILMTFVKGEIYYFNPQSYRVSMLQKLRTVTEIQLGK